MIFMLFLITSCKSQVPVPVPPFPLSLYDIEKKYDTTFYWCSNDYKLKNSDSSKMALNEVIGDFYINNGQLYERNKGIVNKTNINYKIDESTSLSIIIDRGKPLSHYYYTIKEIYPQCSQDDTRQFLKNHLKVFKEGKGEWQDFYFKIYKNNYIERPLKERGEVKDNFKYREWSYYSAEGGIDSTKVYTVNDSIDVRFPHCLFNKKEPCYNKKKAIVIKESINKVIEEEDLTMFFGAVEETPKFLGCTEKIEILNKECFESKIKVFLKDGIKKSNITVAEKTRALISFTILKDGTIGGIKIRAKTKQLEEEIIKIIQNLPIIVAGKQNGKTVNVIYQLPIYFEPKM